MARRDQRRHRAASDPGRTARARWPGGAGRPSGSRDTCRGPTPPSARTAWRARPRSTADRRSPRSLRTGTSPHSIARSEADRRGPLRPSARPGMPQRFVTSCSHQALMGLDRHRLTMPRLHQRLMGAAQKRTMNAFLSRIRHLLHRNRLDADLREEIETHRTLRQEALERDGIPPETAHDMSRRALGNVSLASRRLATCGRSVPGRPCDRTCTPRCAASGEVRDSLPSPSGRWRSASAPTRPCSRSSAACCSGPCRCARQSSWCSWPTARGPSRSGKRSAASMAISWMAPSRGRTRASTRPSEARRLRSTARTSADATSTSSA